MNSKAICLITFSPNELNLDFLSTFINYDIYVIIDDNLNTYSELKTRYNNKINFIQIENINCANSGFKNTSSITLKKSVAGWDKALFYFACNHAYNYDYVWFMEDDVYFYNENTLIDIDNKYDKTDLLCNSSFKEAKLNEWLWYRININFPTPYYCGMVCICRFSRNMLESIKDYTIQNKTLFFLEALFPTIAVKYNLTYISNPIEFITVTHRENFSLNYELLNKTNLYHPIKDVTDHIKIREQ
jgi:hypothetical protein